MKKSAICLLHYTACWKVHMIICILIVSFVIKKGKMEKKREEENNMELSENSSRYMHICNVILKHKLLKNFLKVIMR